MAAVTAAAIMASCLSGAAEKNAGTVVKEAPAEEQPVLVDTLAIPHDKFGESVRYGRELMLRTAYYIGPNGINGQYLGNKMNCTNCHQDAGTKPYAFNLVASHENYPQYRAREGKVLTLAERVNNCVMRPHNGKPLPLDSKEMIAFLSYLKWINSFAPKGSHFKGEKNLDVHFPDTAANPVNGKALYSTYCSRCHGTEGQGQLTADNGTYTYPPLWGANAYQPGSSMHRVIKQAQWLKANMPYDKATHDKPFLTDAEALDIAAFVNDDKQHTRPGVKSFDYPVAAEKPVDYDHPPFVDSFSVEQHKFGPYKPVVDSWKAKGMKAVY
ncbi:cytochrome C class I [Deminuibacter soli]|uniref:Cytochrome C class I n=2 Tax=Deminuibacter soli TaxID=2291815 RepID=A0A3E1NHZ4_9BACT|nr:cytochrome C class I [Deminuibacter soli]